MKPLSTSFNSLTQTLVFVGIYFLTSISTAAAQGEAGTQSVRLENYLNVDTIEGLLLGILDIVIIIAIPIIIFFIIYSGFLYVTARGNPDKLSQAGRALTYAIIGGVLVIGAFAITEIIKNLVDAF